MVRRVALLAFRAVPVADTMLDMHPRPGHRKRVRHYRAPGHLHELTFSCYHRCRLLTSDVWRAMLARGIDQAMGGHRYRLAAFVFVPEHLHLMIYPHHTPVRRGLVKRAVDESRPTSGRIASCPTARGSCPTMVSDTGSEPPAMKWSTNVEVSGASEVLNNAEVSIAGDSQECLSSCDR
jgi:hypothetical protein